MKKSKRILNALTYLFLTIGVVLILFPMYITVVTALKTPDEMSANFFGLPSTLYLGNFDEVIHKAYFGNFVFNSLFITLFSLLGIGVFVPLVSYAIARNFKKKYYRLIYILFISGAFVPFTVVMVPQIKLMSYLNAMNSYGLILLYWVFALSEGCLLTVSYVNSIPKELDEAAFIDGAGHWKQMLHVTLPAIVPTIILMTALAIGNIMSAGFDQVFNMYNEVVYESGDILDTLVYRMGFGAGGQFGLSTAAGLFKSVISCTLVIVSYRVAYKTSGYRVF